MDTVILVWLGGLTLLSVLCIRQIAVLSLQAEANVFAERDPNDDGMMIGDAIPSQLRDAFADADPNKPWFALVLSSTCTQCFDLAFNLNSNDVESPIVAMVAGRPEMTENIRKELPPDIPVIEDPVASELVRSGLELKTVPFVFEFRQDQLAAKAALQNSDHLKRFMAEANSVSNLDFVEARIATPGKDQEERPLVLAATVERAVDRS